MVIDTSYFIYKETFIPGAKQQPSIGDSLPDFTQELQQFIDEKEFVFLSGCLGVSQTKELLSQFKTDGSWKDDALQKWKDLVDGLDDWKGLRYTIGQAKYSLIAYYVYFYYIQSDWKKLTTVGVQIPEVANSSVSVPYDKQVNAWNKFVSMYNKSYYSNRPEFFSNWNGTGMMWNGYNRNNEVDLYTYLTSKSDLYDTSKFIPERMLNPNGL